MDLTFFEAYVACSDYRNKPWYAKMDNMEISGRLLRYINNQIWRD